MTASHLAPLYRFVSELLVHPDERGRVAVARGQTRLGKYPPAVAAALKRFLTDPQAWSADEYVQTIELAPPCPLYLGAYLFDEPSTCRDIGRSERNAYMVELNAVYRHFGLELLGRELPDFLPVVTEFLALSLERIVLDRIGLRRRFVERYVRPGLGPLREKLGDYQSPYALLVAALEAAVVEDLHRMGGTPAWTPSRVVAAGGRLPVLAGAVTAERRRGEVDP